MVVIGIQAAVQRQHAAQPREPDCILMFDLVLWTCLCGLGGGLDHGLGILVAVQRQHTAQPCEPCCVLMFGLVLWTCLSELSGGFDLDLRLRLRLRVLQIWSWVHLGHLYDGTDRVVKPCSEGCEIAVTFLGIRQLAVFAFILIATGNQYGARSAGKCQCLRGSVNVGGCLLQPTCSRRCRRL